MITTALQVAIRAATAAGQAVAIAQVLWLEFPIYALIAAILFSYHAFPYSRMVQRVLITRLKMFQLRSENRR
jgi:hypothetical protein